MSDIDTWRTLTCKQFANVRLVGDAQDLIAGHCRRCDEDFAAYEGDAITCTCGNHVPHHQDLASVDPAEVLSVVLGASALVVTTIALLPSWLAGVYIIIQGAI